MQVKSACVSLCGKLKLNTTQNCEYLPNNSNSTCQVLAALLCLHSVGMTANGYRFGRGFAVAWSRRQSSEYVYALRSPVFAGIARMQLGKMNNTIGKQEAIYFRNRFRDARAAAEKSDWDCMEIIYALEDFGQVLTGKMQELEGYESCVTEFVKTHCLDEDRPQYQIDFGRLYAVVRQARNSAVHRGARSRYFAPRAVELILIMEDALMRAADTDKAKDYMAASPVVAQLWQPLSIIRKEMLTNSFTHIPYFDKDKGEWFVVSDAVIARYLRPRPYCTYKKSRLNHTLEKALSKGMRRSKPLVVVCPDDLVSNVVCPDETEDKTPISGLPILVRHPKHNEHLLGILTASDLM